ncbi:MAG: ABC transporter substrate-binding protein [Pseudomonadota bacterium]
MKLLTATAMAVVLSTSSMQVDAAARDLNMAVSAKSAGQLDPHVSTKTQDKILFGMMFNGLVRFAPGSMAGESIEPDLAESWTSSDDGLVWTFKLREGVQFHHGYGELKASDVVYSLNRAGDPDRSGVASDYAQFESVEAVDDYTVKITLSQSIPSLLGVVANYHGGNIVSAKASQEMGENFKSKPVGTGPFAFEELAEGRLVRLVAHQDYFRGAPSIDGVTLRYIPSSSARDLAFRNGELDLIQGTREDRWVNNFSDGIVDVFEPGELRTLHINTTKPPFDDIRVRQALAYALNREELVAFAGSNVARANEAPVPDGYYGHDSSIEGISHDLDKAKELLAEAGYPDGFTTKVAITELASLNAPMQVIQGQLAKAGIMLDLDVMEHSSWHAAIRDDVSSLVLYGAARFPVADTYLTQFYHSDSIVKTPTAVTNFSHCDVADAEIVAARSEPDTQMQLDLWATAQKKLVDNVCAIPVFELLQVWGRSEAVDYGLDLQGSLSLGPVINENTTLN